MDEEPTPLATYRLQLKGDFGFDDARELVPYFSRLGVTHVYSSPVLRARSDSTHGYDVVDPATINPNLGDETEFRELASSLRAHGMGLILDIVPNHMAANPENPAWRHVLTYGPSSPFARWFDIDWRQPDAQSWGRVLVPVLGEPLKRVLAKGQIQVQWDEGRISARYFDHVFPIDPATAPMICRFGLLDPAPLDPSHPSLAEIRDILDQLAKLPRRATRLRRQVELPLDEIETWLSQLAQKIEASPQVREWMMRTCGRFSQGEEGAVRLRKLLDAQSHRLVYWRQAARAINYRRFFDINDLISVRQEDPDVFAETHALVGRWIGEGLLDGVRIDHLDGLRDPLGYLERLAELAANGRDAAAAAAGPFHVFVEKILAPGEILPPGWPSDGTSGYEFLNQVEAIFIHPEGFEEIEDNYLQWLGRPARFKNIVARGKRRVLKNDLSAYVGRLANMLLRLARYDDRNAELSEAELVDALVEVVVGLPVYRTYIDASGEISPTDRGRLEAALSRARRSQRAVPEALAFLRQVLLLAGQDALPPNEQQERINFLQRFQQLTGPAAAKGVEDTALYSYVPLVSLNEVGGEPDLPLENAVDVLHRENGFRARRLPFNMLSATTHDTKRSADVRSRLDVLSEVPKLWSGLMKRWQRLNRPHASLVGGKLAPDPAMECLFYQSLLGLWPAPDPSRADEHFPDGEALNQLRERLEEYMLKAAREAKTRTTWTKRNAGYEDALVTFIRSAMLPGDDKPPFLGDVHGFVARIARPGYWNALSRTLIQFAAPGTPDLYQGDELWNFALVDPDNRRAVDYEHRKRLLDEIVTAHESTDNGGRAALLQELVESPEDGRIKLHLIRCALHARREHRALFAGGDYESVPAEGPAEENVFAFARRAGAVSLLAVAPRLTTSLVADPAEPPIGPGVWTDTALALPDSLRGRAWTSALTGETLRCEENKPLPLADVLASFPVALLLAADGRR